MAKIHPVLKVGLTRYNMSELIKAEECSNVECHCVEERMATVLVVDETGISSAKRLCKSCVSAYLKSQQNV